MMEKKQYISTHIMNHVETFLEEVGAFLSKSTMSLTPLLTFQNKKTQIIYLDQTTERSLPSCGFIMYAFCIYFVTVLVKHQALGKIYVEKNLLNLEILRYALD